MGIYIHDIGVGLSALLVSTNRAMREPLHCGTSDRAGSTFLCVWAIHENKHCQQGSRLTVKNGLAEMIDIIQSNPYRLLGIYSNSPTKERVANHNRMKVFLNVGKVVSFPLDLPTLLPTINRTTENIAEADATLTLPNEQLRYAQFWFVKSTPIDGIAMNHLIAGNIDNAVAIWQKKDDASSLQNRIVCSLIHDDYNSAIAYADKLYSLYAIDFANLVLGNTTHATTDNLSHAFLDELCDAVSAQKLLPYLQNKEWKLYVGDKTVKPLIATLQSAINVAKASRGQGIGKRLAAGTKLMNDTKASLVQLKALLPTNDLQYQIIADKLGLEILQCGIDYYNDSEAADAAHKAMKLQAYALSIVVGKMAKDRCKENVDILQNIIDSLPPQEVFAEDKAIKEELRKFCQQPDKICHAVTLLNNAKPHLQAIKQKLGATSAYYLNVSTQVVGNALHNVIEEVNATQCDDDVLSFISGRDKASFAIQRLTVIKTTLEAAWDATMRMDTFDMESGFLRRYKENRSILEGMCNQLGVSTVTYIPWPSTHSVSKNPSVPKKGSSISKNVIGGGKKPLPKQPTGTKNNHKSSDGCLFKCFGVVFCISSVIVLCAIGNFIADEFGTILGFIVGVVVGMFLFEKIVD